MIPERVRLYEESLQIRGKVLVMWKQNEDTTVRINSML